MSIISTIRDMLKYGGTPPSSGILREEFFLRRALRKGNKKLARLDTLYDRPDVCCAMCACPGYYELWKKQGRRQERLTAIERKLNK